MKISSFFLKSWFVSLLVVVVTLIVGGFSFYVFTSFFLEKNQEEEFQESYQSIKKEIEANGINADFLETYIQKGYSVIVKDDNGLVFSSNKNMEFYASDSVDQLEVPADKNEEVPGVLFSNLDKIQVGQKEMYLHVLFPKRISLKEYQSVLLQTIPFLIFIGLIVSTIAAVIVSNFFQHKIKSLNVTINTMSRLEHQPFFTEKAKDEMSVFENNLNKMYVELKSNVKKLEEDYEYIEWLESERQIFIKGATHELKTPIMSMSTMIEGMLSNLPEYQNHDEYLQKCYIQLKSMTQLVNELLEISRIEGFHIHEKCNVKQSIDKVLEVLEVLIQDKQLQIEENVFSDLYYTIPEKYFMKVLSNLIGNAVQYGKQGSKVTIYSHEDKLSLSNKVNHVEFIQEKDIFRPFVSYAYEEQEDRNHGLGLFIVKTILEKYGYKISYEIQLEKIVFTISREQGNRADIEKSRGE